MCGSALAPLSEMDRDEMRDIYRALHPEPSDEEFDAQWAEFEALKAARAAH